MSTLTGTPATVRAAPWAWLVLYIAAWIAAYAALTPFADAVTAGAGLTRQTHLGEAVHFFFYDAAAA